jgi:Pre-mRNA splicing Prp18-interacting factor
MRDNPNPSANPEDLAFAGDNFSRYSGDVKNYAQTQVYAWDAANRGQVSTNVYYSVIFVKAVLVCSLACLSVLLLLRKFVNALQSAHHVDYSAMYKSFSLLQAEQQACVYCTVTA